MQLHLFTLSITQHGSQSLHVQEKISNWNTIITATGTQWNTGTRWTRYGKILNLPDIIIPCIANENFPNCINLSVECCVWTIKIENDTYNVDTESKLNGSYCEYCLTMSECSSAYSSLVYYQCYDNKITIENCSMHMHFLNSRLCFDESAFMERYGNKSTIRIQCNQLNNSYEKTFNIGKIKLICTTIFITIIIGINSTHVYTLDSTTTTNITPSPSSSSQDSPVNSTVSSTVSSTMSSTMSSTTRK